MKKDDRVRAKSTAGYVGDAVYVGSTGTVKSIIDEKCGYVVFDHWKHGVKDLSPDLIKSGICFRAKYLEVLEDESN